MITERQRLDIIDTVAEAVHNSLFEEQLGGYGTIERELYRNAAEAGLRAGVEAFSQHMLAEAERRAS